MWWMVPIRSFRMVQCVCHLIDWLSDSRKLNGEHLDATEYYCLCTSEYMHPSQNAVSFQALSLGNVRKYLILLLFSGACEGSLACSTCHVIFEVCRTGSNPDWQCRFWVSRVVMDLRLVWCRWCRAGSGVLWQTRGTRWWWERHAWPCIWVDRNVSIGSLNECILRMVCSAWLMLSIVRSRNIQVDQLVDKRSPSQIVSWSSQLVVSNWMSGISCSV